MVEAWGGWSLFQALFQTLKKVSLEHGVSVATVAVRYILNQVFSLASTSSQFHDL
jgi:aryl-alcohol dehydrogenase-like predicted oxidoreductase